MGGKGLLSTQRQVAVGMQEYSYSGCSVIVITDTVPVQLCPSAVVHGAAPGLAVAVTVAAAPLSAAAGSAVCSATVVTATACAGCLPPPCQG
jgi:hypothetical protein